MSKIYRDNELDKKATIRNFRIVISKRMNLFLLVLISGALGY